MSYNSGNSIKSDAYSIIYAGYNLTGNNSIYSNNNKNASAKNNSSIYARSNYWGASIPDATKIVMDASSSIIYISYLASDPTTGGASSNIKIDANLSKTSNKEFGVTDVFEVMSDNNYAETGRILVQLLSVNLNSDESFNSIIHLSECYSMLKNNCFDNYLENNLRQKLRIDKPKFKNLFIRPKVFWNVKKGNYHQALGNLDKLMTILRNMVPSQKE